MKWTKKEDDILRKLYSRSDIPISEILKVFPGRTWQGVMKHARVSLNLYRGNDGKVNQEQLSKLEKVYRI